MLASGEPPVYTRSVLRNVSRSLTIAAALVLVTPGAARAASLEVAMQPGVMVRKLADTEYRPGFNLQIASDVVLHRHLAVGAYFNGFPWGGAATPTRLFAREIGFRTFGVRARGILPVSKAIEAYAVTGIAAANVDTPEIAFDGCAAASASSPCEAHYVARTNRWFTETLFGAGLLIKAEAPFAFSFEGDVRPSFGYRNAYYEQLVNGPNAREGGAGLAWSFRVGVVVVTSL